MATYSDRCLPEFFVDGCDPSSVRVLESKVFRDEAVIEGDLAGGEVTLLLSPDERGIFFTSLSVGGNEYNRGG